MTPQERVLISTLPSIRQSCQVISLGALMSIGGVLLLWLDMSLFWDKLAEATMYIGVIMAAFAWCMALVILSFHRGREAIRIQTKGWTKRQFYQYHFPWAFWIPSLLHR